MVVDFYDIKGNYITDIDLSDNEAKILIRYAILDILKKTKKKELKNKRNKQ